MKIMPDDSLEQIRSELEQIERRRSELHEKESALLVVERLDAIKARVRELDKAQILRLSEAVDVAYKVAHPVTPSVGGSGSDERTGPPDDTPYQAHRSLEQIKDTEGPQQGPQSQAAEGEKTYPEAAMGVHANVPEILELAREAETVGHRHPNGKKLWKNGKDSAPLELVRNRAQKLGKFTEAELLASLGLSVKLARSKTEPSAPLRSLLDAEMARPTGKQGYARAVQHRRTGRGKQAQIYEFVKPVGAPINRERRPTPEQEAVLRIGSARGAGSSRGAAVPGTGGGSHGPNKEVTALIRDLQGKGMPVRRLPNQHYSVTVPSGQQITFSSTPSDVNGVNQARRDLRKAGVPV